ncbi:Lactate-binding periplasmic protein [subsurface metagenome]
MTNKPINRIADLEGMKIRSSGANAEWLTKCGASTVFVAGGELYTALATGVVDGAHWGHAGPMYAMKFHEVLKYFMKPAVAWGSWNQLYINMDVWNKFTPQQRIAIETAAQASAQFSTLHTQVLSRRALKSMVEDYGVQVITLPEEEQAKARELAIESWEAIAKKNPRNAQIIDMIKAFLKETELPLTIEKYPW